MLVLGLLLLHEASGFAAVIVAVNMNDGIIYADLQPNERSEYTKGDNISFFLLPERDKYSGKVTEIIQKRRLLIEVEGGAYAMHQGSLIELRRKQTLKKFGRRNSIIDRSDNIYRRRRNFSIFAGAAEANAQISLSKALLLIGGGVGISLPWDTELEGHYWSSGDVAEATYTATMSVASGQLKKFISNVFFAFGGVGYRSTTVTLKSKKKADSTAGEGGVPGASEGTTDTGDNAENSGPNMHFSKDIVAEIGFGARVQIPTYIIGKSMIVGADLGSWYLASILDASPELNLELETAFPLPGSTFFGRVYGGFSF